MVYFPSAQGHSFIDPPENVLSGKLSSTSLPLTFADLSSGDLFPTFVSTALPPMSIFCDIVPFSVKKVCFRS